jgi:TolB protein
MQVHPFGSRRRAAPLSRRRSRGSASPPPQRLRRPPRRSRGANGPIAFERFATKHEDDRTAQIFVRSPSGAVRQITHFPGGAFNPAWSPDGARIAFDRWFIAQRQPDQILTINADGSDARPLTSGCTAANCLADDSPSYSPNGRQIAFVRYYKPVANGKGSAADLMLVPATGGAPRILRHFAGDPLPDQAVWSPDGSRIVFNSQGGHSPFVYVVRPDGSGLRKITRRTRVFSRNPSDPKVALVAQFEPSWSPDGRQILFTNEPKPCSGHHRDSCSRDPQEAQPRNLFVMNADGTGVRRLTRSPCFEGEPALFGQSRCRHSVPTHPRRSRVCTPAEKLMPYLMPRTNSGPPAHAENPDNYEG